MDIPNPRTVKDITKRGYLQKLAPRTFPYIPHPWKRKFCLLVKDRIYYYDKEESRASDKGTGVIALQYFDQISEASSKESKKANNVFIVATRDKRFSDQNRHLFSADSAEDMRDWLLLIKRAIENTRDTKSEAVLAKSAPSSPRAPSVISKDTKGANAEGEAGKVKKWRSGEEKENGANDINRVSDPSIRKKRSDPNSKTADGTHPKNELPESEGPPNSNCSSLGRKGRGKLIQSNPKVDFKYAPGDLEGMMFGSLGRQLKVDKAKTGSSQVSGGSNNSEHSESFGSVSMDSKKRKAEEQSNDDFLQTSSESSQKMERLESVTKNRVKGPPGRRMPQHRRGHLMKHRASSMSALAKDGKPEIGAEAEGNENAIRSDDLMRRPDSYGHDFRNSNRSDSCSRESVSSIGSKSAKIIPEEFDSCVDKSKRLSFLIEEEDIGKTEVKDKQEEGEVCDLDNNNSNACDVNCSEVDVSNNLDSSSCFDSSSKLTIDDESTCLKKENEQDETVSIRKGNSIIRPESIKSNRESERSSSVIFRDKNSNKFSTPSVIETVDCVQFDDIDDFFNSSKSFFDIPEEPVSDKKINHKKKVTIQEKSRGHKPSLSRFRRTLASFRRVRLKSDRDLTDSHPDDIDRKSATFCVIL